MSKVAQGRQLDILRILASRGGEEMTGGDIKEVNPKLSRGTIYPVLQSLHHDGLVSLRSEKLPRMSGPPTVFYKITAAGQVALRNGEVMEALLAGAKVQILPNEAKRQRLVRRLIPTLACIAAFFSATAAPALADGSDLANAYQPGTEYAGYDLAKTQGKIPNADSAYIVPDKTPKAGISYDTYTPDPTPAGKLWTDNGRLGSYDIAPDTKVRAGMREDPGYTDYFIKPGATPYGTSDIYKDAGKYDIVDSYYDAGSMVDGGSVRVPEYNSTYLPPYDSTYTPPYDSTYTPPYDKGYDVGGYDKGYDIGGYRPQQADGSALTLFATHTITAPRLLLAATIVLMALIIFVGWWRGLLRWPFLLIGFIIDTEEGELWFGAASADLAGAKQRARDDGNMARYLSLQLESVATLFIMIPLVIKNTVRKHWRGATARNRG